MVSLQVETLESCLGKQNEWAGGFHILSKTSAFAPAQSLVLRSLGGDGPFFHPRSWSYTEKDWLTSCADIDCGIVPGNVLLRGWLQTQIKTSASVQNLPIISYMRHTNLWGDDCSGVASLQHWEVHSDSLQNTLLGQKEHFWTVICEPALLCFFLHGRHMAVLNGVWMRFIYSCGLWEDQ